MSSLRVGKSAIEIPQARCRQDCPQYARELDHGLLPAADDRIAAKLVRLEGFDCWHPLSSIENSAGLIASLLELQDFVAASTGMSEVALISGGKDCAEFAVAAICARFEQRHPQQGALRIVRLADDEPQPGIDLHLLDLNQALALSPGSVLEHCFALAVNAKLSGYLPIPRLRRDDDRAVWVDEEICPLTIGRVNLFGPDPQALLTLAAQLHLCQRSDD